VFAAAVDSTNRPYRASLAGLKKLAIVGEYLTYHRD